MEFGRNAGGGGVWCLLLLAGAAMAVAAETTSRAKEVAGPAAATAIAKSDAVASEDDCMALCYEKFLDGEDKTEKDHWKCVDDCPALNHGAADRGIHHAAARAIRHTPVAAAAAKPDVVVRFVPSCIGICYEQFDGKSEEELDKCIDNCPDELDHAVIRAIRHVV